MEICGLKGCQHQTEQSKMTTKTDNKAHLDNISKRLEELDVADLHNVNSQPDHIKLPRSTIASPEGTPGLADID